ncbi:MAG: hypothetical protein JXR91_03480 [Deltaproteobacteria bacterium]|nr:hypothetical protein [Deltaproteobacteria bacterium]
MLKVFLFIIIILPLGCGNDVCETGDKRCHGDVIEYCESGEWGDNYWTEMDDADYSDCSDIGSGSESVCMELGKNNPRCVYPDKTCNKSGAFCIDDSNFSDCKLYNGKYYVTTGYYCESDEEKCVDLSDGGIKCVLANASCSKEGDFCADDVIRATCIKDNNNYYAVDSNPDCYGDNKQCVEMSDGTTACVSPELTCSKEGEFCIDGETPGLCIKDDNNFYVISHSYSCFNANTRCVEISDGTTECVSPDLTCSKEGEYCADEKTPGLCIKDNDNFYVIEKHCYDKHYCTESAGVDGSGITAYCAIEEDTK